MGRKSTIDDNKDRNEPISAAKYELSSFYKVVKARDLFQTKAFFNGLLKEKDIEIKKAEDFYRDQAIKDCKRLITRFDKR